MSTNPFSDNQRFFAPLGADDHARLDTFYSQMREAQKTFTGYPCNQIYDYSDLMRFMGLSLNNVGDPYGDSTFRMHSRQFEQEVIAWYAGLTHAKPDETWGYVTNGGTEGNLYGLYLARELYPNAIFYFSQETHYSVAKNLNLLNVRNIMIASQENGEMDYDDLRETIKMHRDVPAVVLVNIGTTMKGAIDNVQEIQAILQRLKIQHSYIHADAALSGMILPFVDDPQPFRFSDGIDSISVSGHKLIGSPMPCGIVLAKRKNVDAIARSIEYVGVLDTTITGSRNAISPMILWYAMKCAGEQGFRAIVDESIRNADYAIAAFAKYGIHAWRNRNSITVVFPRPSMETLYHWQMAPEHAIAHVITLPHVTPETIDRLVADVAKDHARDKQTRVS
ncbi:MAG: histidine decarboxylase [Alphaproteobacteria bacterium]|nr:MAG: histidine decarboxylase [Alphaproteobacteria bacterium]TAF76692.1 MAG: histidine decarboxylase [Alphaproteobacteria bacterium]